MQPNVQYDTRQAGTDYAVYHPTANQFSSHATSVSALPSGAYAAPNNQGASPMWYPRDCWVSYMVEDELHLTIALKRTQRSFFG
jgi:hypothetical protein